MDGIEFSLGTGVENENANFVKKKRRSILKVTNGSNNEREALKVKNFSICFKYIPALF